MGINGDNYNGYKRGQVYANSGYDPFSGFDYAFRTYTNDDSITSNVPEPPHPLRSSVLALPVLVSAAAEKPKHHSTEDTPLRWGIDT